MVRRGEEVDGRIRLIASRPESRSRFHVKRPALRTVPDVRSPRPHRCDAMAHVRPGLACHLPPRGLRPRARAGRASPRLPGLRRGVDVRSSSGVAPNIQTSAGAAARQQRDFGMRDACFVADPRLVARLGESPARRPGSPPSGSGAPRQHRVSRPHAGNTAVLAPCDRFDQIDRAGARLRKPPFQVARKEAIRGGADPRPAR